MVNSTQNKCILNKIINKICEKKVNRLFIRLSPLNSLKNFLYAYCMMKKKKHMIE